MNAIQRIAATLLIPAICAFFGAYYGARSLTPALAQQAPYGAGGPPGGNPTCPDSTLTCSGANVSLNTANATTIGGNWTFTGTPTFSNIGIAGASDSLTGLSAGLAQIGYGSTTPAISIGWQNATLPTCVSSCATSNSKTINVCGMSATGPLCQAPFVDTAGVLEIGKLKVTNSLDAGANPIKNISKIGTNAACSGSGTFTGPALNNETCMVTLVAGAAQWNFGTAYAAAPAPNCTDTTAVNAVKCTATTGGVTITGTSTDVISVHVDGNGGV